MRKKRCEIKFRKSKEEIEKLNHLYFVRSKSVSVLGLMTPCSKLFQRTYEGSVNSQTMIDFLDEFCETISKKTVIILDNAPIHKSKIFKAKIKEWEEQDLIIYFIPPYSPELNLIEPSEAYHEYL